MDQPFFLIDALILGFWLYSAPKASTGLPAELAAVEAPGIPVGIEERPELLAAASVESAVVLPGAEIDETGEELDAPRTGPPAAETAARKQMRAWAIDEDPEHALDDTGVQRLVIPSLEVDARVLYKPFNGVTWDIQGLRTDVAWLGGTSSPGEGGNTVLAGHIMVQNLGRGPFRYLDRLKPGESLIVYSRLNRYIYQVREQILIKDTQVSVIEDTGSPQLTLITCSIWDEESETYLRRRAVFADLVRVEPISGQEAPYTIEGMR